MESVDPGPLRAAGGFDIRGWEVRTLVDDARVGSAQDVLAGTDGAPRYLALLLEPAEPTLLLPIGAARAYRVQRRIWVPGLTAALLRGLPRLPLATHERERELELLSALRAATSGGAPGREPEQRLTLPFAEAQRAGLYEDAHYDVRAFFGPTPAEE